MRVFQSHQKSQIHEILALGLIGANLKHVEALFSKIFISFCVPFFRIKYALCPNFMVPSVKMGEIFEKTNTKKAPKIRKNQNFENRAS